MMRELLLEKKGSLASLYSSISSLPGFSVWASLDPSHWNSGWWMISWTTRKRTIKERSSEPWEESFSVEKSIRNKKELNYCEKHVEKKMLLHDKWSRGSFPSSTTTSEQQSCWKGQFIQVEKAFQQHHTNHFFILELSSQLEMFYALR